MNLRSVLIFVAKLSLLGFSLLFSVGVGEVALRLMGYQAIFEVYSKPSILWQHDETRGWSHEPSTEARYIGPRPWPIEFDSLVEINSDGLRGPEIEAVPEDGVRILLLGDSMVAGFEVEHEETFAVQMERMLSEALPFPVQVINAGVRGYGTDQSYLYYRERGRKFEPDIVLMWLSANDLVNDVTIHRMRRIFGKPAFVKDEAGGIELVGSPVPLYPECSAYQISDDDEIVRIDSRSSRIFCRLQLTLFDRSALFSYLTHLVPWEQWGGLLRDLYYFGMPKDVAPKGSAVQEGAEVVTARIVEKMAAEVEATGTRYVVTSAPQTLKRLASVGVPIGELQAVYLEKFGAADLAEVRFKHDSHMNPKGHRMVARTLTDALLPVIRELKADVSPRSPR